jgi:hypothetical protein
MNIMVKMPLNKTNSFLKDPARRREGLIRFVVSSSAIEGIYVALPENQPVAPEKNRPNAHHKPVKIEK